MANDLICPIHGPYSATLGSCPYCASGTGGRPRAPQPLDAEDDMPTDLGGMRQGSGRPSFNDDDAPTDLPIGRKGGHRILDIDEEATDLGHRRDIDETELEFKEEGPQAIFWAKEGPRRGKIYKIKDEMIIGRRDADLVIDDPKVSGIHAKIVLENDHFVVVDFKSKNGTFVNGEKIRSETPLKENDLLKIGEATFVLKLLD